MVNKYFTLTNSNNSLSKKFAIVLQGYETVIDKMQTLQTTVDGEIDAAFGGIYETHTYTIRVRETETRDGYGNENDLKTFFRLNNPNGTPSNVVTLTDNFGVDHDCFMVGQYSPSLLGIMIEGLEAWKMVKCTFRFIPVPVGS